LSDRAGAATLPASPAGEEQRRKETEVPRPEDTRAYRRHAEWALAVATAVDLGLLDELAERPGSAEDLSARLGFELRGTAALLGALEVMGVVRREAEGYRLTGSGRGHFVDAQTPDYQADSLRNWLKNVRRWAIEMPDAVRGSRADGPRDPARGPRDPASLPGFMAAMANKPPDLVESVVEAVREAAPKARTLLDLGGGPGTFARAFARGGFSVTLVDRPEVLEYVGGAYGLAEEPRIELLGGDFLEALPQGSWDVVMLANITHIYPKETNAALLRRAAGCVSRKGVLAVLDFVKGKSDFAALFAITMLLNTEGGGTYDLERYELWLEEAGLGDVRCVSVSEDTQLLIGRRPGAGRWR
jgi:SAM-dependent methyltransferase